MSLALVQAYSSDEEGQEALVTSESDEEVAPVSKVEVKKEMQPSVIAQQQRSSLLPSPADVFAEVTGPPEYLRFAVTGPLPSRPHYHRVPQPQSHTTNPQALGEPNPKVASALVVEAKPCLVTDGVDKEGGVDGRKLPGAALPPPEDAAALLRMCLKCGVPKTFSTPAGGMVCPMCNDRPETETEGEKKKRSVIKDKEKSKRMRGQSSHASWKSETEMHLRQQFD